MLNQYHIIIRILLNYKNVLKFMLNQYQIIIRILLKLY